ncbi:MAG: hypothetical protein DYG92_06660 [Leptolyngbya sp. PLA1]|nr:hypothetical protein [Leptolyngbya sp. PLA1]
MLIRIIMMVCAGAGAANAQLVVGNDQSSGATIWLVDVSGARPPRALVTGTDARVRALAADDAGRVLYWITPTGMFRADYTPSGLLTPVSLGPITGLTRSVLGLGYDVQGARLIGQTQDGLVQINPATAAGTPILSLATQDLGGLDFEPVSGVLYGANDSVLSGPLGSRGVYRIDAPLESPSFSRVAPYPGTVTDFDGLAVGPGRAYLVYQTSAEPIHVLDLQTGQWVQTLPNPLAGSATSAGATWAPGLMALGPTADIQASVGAPAACTLQPGDVAEFIVSVTNRGPQAAGAAAAISLPADAPFAGSTPTMTPAAGVLHWQTPVLASGASASATVRVVPQNAGPIVLSVAASGSLEDPIASNNAASAQSVVRSPLPAAASVRAVLVEGAGVPGLPGVTIAAEGLGRPVPSPNGRWWVLRALTTDGGAVLLRGEGEAVDVVARTGGWPQIPSALGGAWPPRTIDPVGAVDDAGRVAFSGETAEPESLDSFVVKQVPGGWVRVAQEGVAVPALGPNVWYGAARGGVTLSAWGDTAFYTSLLGPGTTPTTREALLALDGNQLLARSGVMLPAGQVNGEFAPYRSFGGPDDPPGVLATDPWGARWLTRCSVDADASHDRVAVMNGVVIAQEGAAGFEAGCLGAPDAPAEFLGVDASGRWWLVGACEDGRSWVALDGQVLARSGGLLPGGTGELWAESGEVFVLAAADASGGLVVGGRTASGGLAGEAVVRPDGSVVLRSNDAVDLNADGAFNDGSFVRAIVPHHGFIDAESRLWAAVDLRSMDAALCAAPDVEVGRALVVVQGPAPPACDPDLNQDGNVDQDDVAYLIDVVGGGENPNNIDPDFSGDGNVDQDDISALINAVGGGGCP